MDAKKLGTFIATQRKQQHMTQEDLANKIFVTSKAISRWERGIGFPDINLLEPLSKALNITVQELIQCEKEEEVITQVLHLAKEEKKAKQRQFNKTFVLALICIIIILFLHIVTLSNYEAGWFICFLLSFLFSLINILFTFYNDNYEPYLLSFHRL